MSEKPVLFVSFRPLKRAENLRAIYQAYDGEKIHICTDDANYKDEIQSGKYDLMVIDEFPMIQPNCKCIMIWHGIQGGKYIGLDQPRPYYSYAMLHFMSRIVTAGHGSVSMFHQCTGVPERKILPLGFPRTDEFVGKKKGDGHTILADKRSYLYVPTFRHKYETPLPDLDWDFLDSQLTDDELFAVKYHPYKDIPIPGSYKHIAWIPSTEPSSPYLYDCDAVVTDYSSIMFDAYLLDKPVVLIEKQPGYTKTRGMYLSYPDQYCSRFATNEADMLSLLRSAHGLTQVEKNVTQLVADMCDGHSCDRIVQLIHEMNCESRCF